ncbi:MAG: ABC transporter substrate-binding protein [Candidatus Accumulibacter sp.]|jgi:NitT/TauT family transport system substrate-binding protein|nr:ABC transporter substrate-binding protein [Accumulibacter sp.]
MRRFSLLFFVFFALLSLNSGAQTASAKLEKESVTIAVGGKNLFYYLPLTIAEQRGFFKDEGLQVEVPDFAGGSKSLQALIGGSADVVSGAYEHTITMQAKDQHIREFVVQGRAPQIVFAVSTKTLPDYKALADLKGKKIGVTAPGSSTWMMAAYLLAKAGLSIKDDVSIIGVGAASTAVTAIQSGQIDALVNLDPVTTLLEKSGSIKIVSDTRTLKDTEEVYGGLMPAAVLYSTEEFIRKNPNTTQALTNAMVRALKWLQTATPDEVADTVPREFLLGDRQLYIAAWKNVKEAMSPDGLMDASGPGVAYKMLQTFNDDVGKKKIDLEQTYTNEFVRKANEKYR